MFRKKYNYILYNVELASKYTEYSINQIYSRELTHLIKENEEFTKKDCTLMKQRDLILSTLENLINENEMIKQEIEKERKNSENYKNNNMKLKEDNIKIENEISASKRQCDIYSNLFRRE